MAGAPFVEPSAPELRAHQRRLRPQFAQTAELTVDVGAGAEVHCPHQIVQSVECEVARPVALEERNLVESRPAHYVAYGTHVSLVLAVGAIFVLHLHHDYRSSVLNGERSELFAHLRHELGYAVHEVRVLLAQTYILLLEQPPGQSAHLPLGAHVRSGAHNDVHAVLLCQAAEGCDVVLSGEVEFAFTLFVYVPEHVEADGVHAERATHPDAVLPVRARNARIVQLGSLHHEGPAVEQKCLVAGCERTAIVVGGACRATRERHYGRE